MILINPSIDPVIFSFGFLEIRWYSLAYIAAFLIGTYLIKYFNNKLELKIGTKLIDDFFIWAIIGVIFGGRIGYVLFYQLESFIQNPVSLFYIWKGGMSFHGGLLGMILSIFLFSKKKGFNFFILSDLVSLVAPIGLFFGRIANFINVELIGRITDFPLAIIYPSIDQFPRHPSQIYEAFFEGILLFLILISIFYRNQSARKMGYISSFFLIFYSIFRFFIEFLREPDQHMGLFFDVLAMGQLLSVPIFIFRVAILLYKKNNG